METSSCSAPMTFTTVGEAVADFGRSLFEQERIRARRYKEKYPTLPLLWVFSRRVNKIGRAISKLDETGTDPAAQADQLIRLVLGSRLSIERRYQLLGYVFDTLEGNGPSDFSTHMEAAAESFHKDAGPSETFFYLQARRRIQEALEPARSLGRKIRKQPASWFLVHDMIPPRRAPEKRGAARKIAYAAAMSLPYSTSGYATRTHGVARGYRGLGLDLTVVTRPPFPLRDKIWQKRAAEIPLVDTIDGVPYHRLLEPAAQPRNMIGYFEQASDALETKLKEIGPDYVIAGSDCVNALPALIASRRLGLPFAYEVRGFWEMTQAARKPLYRLSTEFAALVALETLVATEADKVLTLTQAMAEELVARGVEPNRLKLMPNGVEPDLIRDDPKDMALAAELGLPAGVPVIGYVGSIVEYEGLDDLAEACARLSAQGHDFRLLVVGSEGSAGKKRPITSAMHAAFQSRGLTGKLIMPGRVAFEEVARYYSLIDIAPIPRKPLEVAEKVSPIKPAEAMALGKLLIVSSVGGLAAFARGGETAMIFEKGNIDDLTRVLEIALTDPEQTEHLRTAGREYVRQLLTWPAICRAAAGHLALHISDA